MVLSGCRGSGRDTLRAGRPPLRLVLLAGTTVVVGDGQWSSGTEKQSAASLRSRVRKLGRCADDCHLHASAVDLAVSSFR